MIPVYQSPAKINRYLRIIRPLPNGYHELDSVMQFLQWGDQMRFYPNRSGTFSLFWEGQPLQSPSSENLILKAAEILKNYLQDPQLGAEIFIKKVIPIGAGLGGGSSNAATTLIVLNQLWNTSISKEDLMALGRGLGTDVPFFIYGVAARVSGIGVECSVVNARQERCLIIPPTHHGQSTAAAFAHLSTIRKNRPASSSHFTTLVSDWTNDFEEGLKERSPETWALLQSLRTLTATGLTGSGNALVTVGTEAQLNRVKQFLIHKKIGYFETEICNESSLFRSA